MEKFGKGTEVAWGRRNAGKVADRFTDDVTRKIDGEDVRRRASNDNPAYLIEQPDGARILKSHSELLGILGDDGDGHLPPEAVAQAAQKGLALREKLKRAGATIGVGHARALKNRKPLPDSTIRQMARFFSRHKVESRAKNWGEAENPSADYVAWLLWGGDPGREWAERRVAAMED